MRNYYTNTLLAAFAVALFTCSTALAIEKEIKVKVDAGKYDRVNVPISVDIELPAALAEAKTVELTCPKGHKLIGQLTTPGLLSTAKATSDKNVVRELHFIAPEVKAGQVGTLTGTVSLENQPKAESFSWVNEKDQYSELKFGDRPVFRYICIPLDETDDKTRYATYKVYHHVYDPKGKRYVTKGVGGLFGHHRGVFYGFNRISYEGAPRVDTWHCTKGAYQSHEEFVSEEAGPVLGRHLLAIDWHGAESKVFARELRELTAYNTPGGILIEFASRLQSKVGKVKLDGDPQHAGFQFRASQDVPDKTAKLTYYIRPDGVGEPGKFRNWPGQKDHANLPWNALCFVLDDQPYTCCYLDRPENPKESRFSERNYGRFGSYFAYEIDTDKPLDLNYRLWLQEGAMTVKGVNSASHDFTDPPKATVVQ